MDAFFNEVDELLKNNLRYWKWRNELSNGIKKEFDGESNCNKKVLKTKIKFYSDKGTDFHNKEMPKVGSNYICLAVILIVFILKKMKLLSASVSKSM